MEVVVGKTSGFCPGVRYAVENAEKELDKNQKIYCLGEIVHNRQVINSLESKGMITVNSIEEIPDGNTVIFRAHGEAKQIYNKAIEKNLNVIDLTCKKVEYIHNIVEKQKKDSFIIILGKKNHPEVIGTQGFAGENSYVIETEDDILDAYIKFENTLLKKVYIIAQTTISSDYFDKLSKEVEKNFIEADCKIDKTVCNATQLRQDETKNMSKVFHKMIIIGGKNSSNTKELFNIADKNCEKVYLIETVDDLENVEFNKNDKIGIMAGASTPEKSIKDVVTKLEN